MVFSFSDDLCPNNDLDNVINKLVKNLDLTEKTNESSIDNI